jgi:purine-binding chemotaxis protein CheW
VQRRQGKRRSVSVQQLVVFSLGSEEYGLPITQVQEIIRYSRPRTIPSAPMSVRGVINLRGKIIPVVDLKSRLGLPPDEEAESKIVIIEAGSVTAGLVVDEVDEVITVDEEQLEQAPTGDVGYIEAVAKVGDRLLVLLDLAAMFAGEGIDADLLAA